MRQRCLNPKNPSFASYGGRSITICDRWKSFENFVADMGEPPPDHEIDRYPDNDGNYEPGNCRWATRREQQNNRRVNRQITLSGATKSIAEWSRETGIHVNTISLRLDRGLSPDRALSPEKRRDISGLALGGRASGDAKLRRTHCQNGHPFDSENSLFNGRQRVCRACKRETEARRREKKRLAPD
jgi:hypothetical protein